MERMGAIVFALGGIAIALSLAGAVWATSHYLAEHRSVEVNVGQNERTGGMVGNTATPVLGARFDLNGQGQPETPTPRRAGMLASAPLGWNELTLMLRTSLSDDEVIAAVAGKQLVVAIGPEETRQLRELGAGNRLINHLQSRTVYDAPTSFSAPNQTSVAGRSPSVPPVNNAAVPSYPAVDYQARARYIADLKQKVDALDERMRAVRSNPKDTRYWWHYRGSNDRIDQTRYDAYCKQIDEERNALRRQKWQLEGR